MLRVVSVAILVDHLDAVNNAMSMSMINNKTEHKKKETKTTTDDVNFY